MRGGECPPDRLGCVASAAHRTMRPLRRADTVKTVSWSSDIGWCQVVTQRLIFGIAFCPRQPKMYCEYVLGAAMKLAAKLFFLSGGLVANRMGATKADDRSKSKPLIDMLYWNAVVMIGLAVFL
jgi:hypothetical protein